MIANSRCIACNLSKKEEKIRKHSDEKKKKEFIQKVTGILYKYGDIESTPMLDKRIQDIYINANIRMYRNDHLKMYKITL